MQNYIILILIHGLSDLVLQGNKLSVLKQNKNLFLFIHIAIIASVLFLSSLFLLSLPLPTALIFTAINAFTHLGIDYVTGILKAKYWKGEKEEAYFVTSAIDQLLHISILLSSYYLVLSFPFV